MSGKSTEATKKMSAWAKFIHWYESYQGKRAVGAVYSIGASIVIVGALFKILHWPGASEMLMIGMFTESFLFFIGVLEKPHPEFNWGNVFPQLLEYGTDPAVLEKTANQPRPTLLGAGVEGGEIPTMSTEINMSMPTMGTPMSTPMGTSAATAGEKVPTLSDMQLESLQNGIAGLARTAEQLSELGQIATATTQLTSKMELAGNAAEQFAASQNTLLITSNQLNNVYKMAGTHVQGVANTTKAVAANMENMDTQLSTINSIYELQIGILQEQVELAKAQQATIGKVSSNLQVLETSVAETQISQEAYKEACKTLATQVADLNSIYGNMLNALA